MALTQSNVSVNYAINNVLGTYKVTDTTNYALYSEDPANWNIYLKIEVQTIEGPQVIYNNLAGTTPDITPSVNTTNQNAIPILKDAQGLPVQGQYTVTGYWKYVTAPDPDTISFNAPFSFELNFDYPGIEIQSTVNCAASTLLSRDVTDYASGSVLLRNHTIYPPAGATYQDGTVAQPITRTTAENVFGPNMFAGRYNVSITSQVSWTIIPGFTLVDTIKGSVDVDVVCDSNLCALTCCVTHVNDYYNELKNNPTAAQIYYNKYLEPTLRNTLLALAALQCGNEADVVKYRDAALLASGCKECKCASNSGEMIYPISTTPSDNVSVDTNMPTLVKITSATNGNNTIYYVDLQAPILAILQNFRITNVQADDSSVSVRVVIVGQLYNYLIKVNPNAAFKNPGINLRVTIYNDSGWKVNYSVMQNSGTMVDLNSIQLTLGNLTPGNPSAADVVFIKISNFLNTLTPFTASANINRTYFLDPPVDPATLANGIKLCEAEVMHLVYTPVNEAAVYIRLYNPQTAAPFTFADLAAMTTGGTVSINLQITPQQS